MEAVKAKKWHSPKAVRAVNLMVENGGNVSKAMRDAGYSPETAKTPQKLTTSKTFRDIMNESGLTDEFLTEALHHDIKEKPKRRVRELELAFKVAGRLSPEGNGGQQTNIQINITGNGGNRFVDANATVVDANDTNKTE